MDYDKCAMGRNWEVTGRSTGLAKTFMQGLDKAGSEYEDGKNKETVFKESQEDISESRHLDRMSDLSGGR